jgi:hypothetical protein
MPITTNDANSFQGSATTFASSNNAFQPFLGSGGGGLVPPNADGDRLLILSADVTNSTTTGVIVPELSFPVLDGRIYLVEGFIFSGAPGVSIGCQFVCGRPDLVSPATSIFDFYCTNYDQTAGLTTPFYTATRMVNQYTANTNGLNSPFTVPHKFITLMKTISPITDPSKTLDFYFKSEVSGSTVTLKTGTFLRVREIV